MSEILKPCPFCKGEAVVKPCRGGYAVVCCACGCSLGDEQKEDATGCFEPFDTKQEAVYGWNSF